MPESAHDRYRINCRRPAESGGDRVYIPVHWDVLPIAGQGIYVAWGR